MRIVSGIQPSGELHIGNYLGMLKHAIALQEANECFYFIADLHALTQLEDTGQYRKNREALPIDLLALGFDPQKSTIFLQSDVPAHTEFMWLLMTMTPVGELERMTQYKDKAKQTKRFVNAGLLAYPVLMAADILLYKAEGVPVGEDQKQHLELTRNIAQRANQALGTNFPLPEPLIPKSGARVMSLLDPRKKMSKSQGPESYIGLFDDDETIRRKTKKAVTDSGKEVVWDPGGKPALANLLTIYSLFAEEIPRQSAKRFAGQGYAKFKSTLADLLIEKLTPFRDKRATLAQSPAHMRQILDQGAQRARSISAETLRGARNRIGLD